MKTIKRKTRHEIIDEIASHYNNKNRSVNANWHVDSGENKCLYHGFDGKKCAMAYLCKDDAVFIEGTSADRYLSQLKPEYAGYSPEFYNSIQNLHDNDVNWVDNGLSDNGQIAVARLKQVFDD